MKALVGSWEQRPYRLLAEITALRARVAELRGELDAAREENDMLREALSRALKRSEGQHVDLDLVGQDEQDVGDEEGRQARREAGIEVDAAEVALSRS
jgi:regulator of replication initiation timing